MNTQNDKRSLMTKKKMADALLLLMKKTPVYQISVQQLTRTADINRSTFYYYYDNIFELLKEIETRFFEELESALDSHMIQKKMMPAILMRPPSSVTSENTKNFICLCKDLQEIPISISNLNNF